MANKRMFSKKVVSTAAFVRKLSRSARLLYYDLGVDADDDGIVEAYLVIAKTGATEEDLMELVSAGYVTILDDDFVTYINDWTKNNTIQKDRYTPSQYSHLLDRARNVSDTEAKCFHNVSTGIGLGSDTGLVTDSGLGGGNPTTAFRPTIPPTLEQVIEYVRKRGNKIDAEKFFDTYAGRQWRKKNGALMTDWKTAVRAWERTEYPDKVRPMNTQPAPRSDAASFETDEFFEAALARSYANMGGEDGEKGESP